MVGLSDHFEAGATAVDCVPDFLHVFLDHNHLPLAELFRQGRRTLDIIPRSNLNHERLRALDLSWHIYRTCKRDQHFAPGLHAVERVPRRPEFCASVPQLRKRGSELLQLLINLHTKQLQLL
jgi:hypothetical protein